MELVNFFYQIQQEYSSVLPGGDDNITLLLRLIGKLCNVHAREEFLHLTEVQLIPYMSNTQK